MIGTVFDIQHFCMDDGPGIRTTVFLKGCPLKCIWCHNPEGLSKKIQLSYSEDKCILCEKCKTICGNHIMDSVHKVNRRNCAVCGKCANICPVGALKLSGKEMSAEEVMADVLKDKVFYENSGGGITLSGGEPFYQSDFSLALLEYAKKAGIHTCVETSGFCKSSVIEKASEFVDLFLFDIKETDSALHKKFTGVDNTLISENLRLLSVLNKSVILRCPVIPGCNDRAEHYIKIAQTANNMKNILEIHIEPYHPFGVDKYYNLGITPGYTSKDFMLNEAAQSIIELMGKHTEIPVKIS